MVFVFMKVGSPFIKLLHSAGKFRGDPFNPTEYQGHIIGFVGDMIQGVNPAVILVEDGVWKWTKAKVVKDTLLFWQLFMAIQTTDNCHTRSNRVTRRRTRI